VAVQMQAYLHPSPKNKKSSSVHASSGNGLIPNAFLMFKTGKKIWRLSSRNELVTIKDGSKKS
jgi:hypothetical protein